jgi:uncharacterized metal-binding protein
MHRPAKTLPLVYACSGCSSAAQLANQVALHLDRRGAAEMSCIAGVGGDVPSLVKLARSGRPIVALDGCPLACAKNCLARHGVVPDRYHALQDYGVRKRLHADFDPAQSEEVTQRVLDDLRTAPLSGTAAPHQAADTPVAA